MKYSKYNILEEPNWLVVFFAAAALLILVAGCGAHTGLTGTKLSAAMRDESWIAREAIQSKGNISQLSPADQQRLYQISGRLAPIALHQEFAALEMQGKVK